MSGRAAGTGSARWMALAVIAASLACGSDKTSDPGGGGGVTSFGANYAWTCATGTTCQDVFNISFAAGSAVTIHVSNVSSGSVSQIALYGPGVALGGINLLTGDTKELRCNPSTGCSNFTGGETVTAFAIGTAGVYRLAVTRDWGNSCGGTGTYRLDVTATKGFTVVGQTAEDTQSQATGFACH